MSAFTFGENPNLFELDLQDGKGEREMYYTLADKTVWVEPQGLNSKGFDESHGSLVDGLLPVRENTKGETAQLIWRLSRPFREYFDVVEAGGTPASNPTQQSQNGSQPDQEASLTQEEQALSQHLGKIPRTAPHEIPSGPPPAAYEMPYLNVDIETYASLKYAPLIENQALIIETYELLMKTHLEPDNPAHEMIEMLKNKSQKLMETYYVSGESETDTAGSIN